MLDLDHDDRPTITRYMQGSCMVMAATLFARYGGQIVGLYCYRTDRAPMHVALRTPDGLYADARGLGMTEDCLTLRYKRWLQEGIRDMSLDDLHRIWDYRIANWVVPDHELEELGLLR